jgi:hypothetical protein
VTEAQDAPATAGQPRIVSGERLIGIRLGPDPTNADVGGVRLEGCMLAVVAEGGKALASGIVLEANNSQLVLEIAGIRTAGWDWLDVIRIVADGIAPDQDGRWVQLLEISTADHTFRFLAPAYQIGRWVAGLPAPGRECIKALIAQVPYAPPEAAPPEAAPVRTTPIDTPQYQPAQAAPVQAAPVQAAPVQAAPVQAAPVQAAPVQAAPPQAAPPQAATTPQPATAQPTTPFKPTAPSPGMSEAADAMWARIEAAAAEAAGVQTPRAEAPRAVTPRAVAPPVGPPPIGSTGSGSTGVQTSQPNWGQPRGFEASDQVLRDSADTGSYGRIGEGASHSALSAPVAQPGAPIAPGYAPPGAGGAADGDRVPGGNENMRDRSNGPPPGPMTGAQGPTTPEPGAPKHRAGPERTTKRRLFGRSARSDQRHTAAEVDASVASVRPRVPATEILRNLLTSHGRHTIHRVPASQATASQATASQATPAQANALSKAGRSAWSPRAWFGPPGAKRRFAPLAIGMLVAGVAVAGSAAAFSPNAVPHRPVAGPVAPDWPQTNGIVEALAPRPKTVIHLAKATKKPLPAPPALSAGPSLESHEVFAFAPYWTLAEESAFNVSEMTTLSYFGVDVNPDGSIQESGNGWTGYESQDLANLITRAHAAGDRFVLTAECFNQTTLNALTSNPKAGTTLGNALVALVEAKSLDGVNIDFEGQGSADQAGLDTLMAQVSSIVRGANAHWQVTMDTYASSAGDPDGFYDVQGLAPSVDAFFVMAYQMGGPSGSTNSQFDGSAFSAQEALKEYTQVVPASKVILGLPYYGYEWPTTGPGANATATGPASPVPDAQIYAEKSPVYWNQASGTAWTASKTGSQWHQTWFEDPTSLSLKVQLADSFDVRGVGIWSLGMDGNDPQNLQALVGGSPVVKSYQVAPTADAVTPPAPTTSTTAPTTTTTKPPSKTKTTGSTTTTTTQPPSSTSTTDPTSTTTTDPGSTSTTEPPPTSTTDPSTTTTFAAVTTSTSS